MFSKTIDKDLIIIETTILPTTNTPLGIVFNYDETILAVRNIYYVINNVILTYQKMLNIDGDIKKDFLVSGEEIKFLVYFEKDDTLDDTFKDQISQFRKLFIQTLKDVEKIYGYHSDIIDNNKDPKITFIESDHKNDDSVLFDGDQTVTVYNQSAYDLAEVCAKQRGELNLSTSKMQIGNEILSLPAPGKDIISKKVINEKDVSNFRIEIMSVNSHNVKFNFRKVGESKVLKGQFDSIETRKKLLQYQIDEKIINAEFNAIIKTGLTLQKTDDFKLISIRES